MGFVSLNDNTKTGNASADVAKIVRILSLLPLVIVGLLYALIPAVRGNLDEGINLLVSGDFDQLQNWAAALGPWALLATLMLMIAQAVFAPIPAVLVTATNSLLFGPFWGGIYSILSANIAAAICYGLARGFGAEFVERLIPRALSSNLDRYFHKHGAMTIVVARLIPFVPFDPISFLAGLFRVPFWPFFWATMIGQIPAGMTYSYLVHQVHNPNMFGVYLISALAALFIIGLILRRVYLSSDTLESK